MESRFFYISTTHSGAEYDCCNDSSECIKEVNGKDKVPMEEKSFYSCPNLGMQDCCNCSGYNISRTVKEYDYYFKEMLKEAAKSKKLKQILGDAEFEGLVQLIEKN